LVIIKRCGHGGAMSLLDCRLVAAVSFVVMFPVNNSYQSHDVRCEPVAGRISPPPMSQRRLPPFAVKCTIARRHPKGYSSFAYFHHRLWNLKKKFHVALCRHLQRPNFSTLLTCSLKVEQWSQVGSTPLLMKSLIRCFLHFTFNF
jgi:hypothetical protein